MTSSSSTAQNGHQLPVIIVGAGPCGLVAALSLQKYGVPFVLIERASRAKICSNAGSGFELAPTAVEILQNRLGIDVSKVMSHYCGMGIMTSEGKQIRHESIPDYDGGSVNRAELQQHLLKVVFPSSSEEEGVLVCGSGIESYQEDEAGGKVVATLTSGEKISGCVLLACDGIQSRCRAVMHGGYDSSKDWETNVQMGKTKDPLHFCNAMVYWGKTPSPKGSDLYNEFSKIVKEDKGSKDEDINRSYMTIGMPTLKAPASIYVVPVKNYTQLVWSITIRSDGQRKSESNDGKDLTRRGGGPLTEAEKKRLFDFTSHGKDSESVVRGIKNFPLLEKLIEVTPAKDITEAGLFDRKNLDLPFSSETKLVALLGDAAHPQTPDEGQGVNMAITDAYVYATNIAVALQTKTKSLKEALSDCDTDYRRKTVKSIVKNARRLCDLSISQNFVVVSLTRLVCKLVSAKAIMNQFDRADKSNRDYLIHLDESQCSIKQQVFLRQEAEK